jgi:hypothetical protein
MAVDGVSNSIKAEVGEYIDANSDSTPRTIFYFDIPAEIPYEKDTGWLIKTDKGGLSEVPSRELTNEQLQRYLKDSLEYAKQTVKPKKNLKGYQVIPVDNFSQHLQSMLSKNQHSRLKKLTKEYIEADNWLKSLRQRCAWKPSIAQLNALSIVSKGNAPDDIEAIVSLYNDLKELT